MSPPRRTALVALAAIALPAAGLPAQRVGGQLTGTAGPVHAIVTLLGPTGGEAGRTTTSPSGRYLVRAARPGTYVMRVARIGQSPWVSDSLRLGAGQTVTLDVRLPDLPVVLQDLVVTAAETACRGVGAASADAALLLEEARKAFILAEEGLAVRARQGTRQLLRVLHWQARYDRWMQPIEVRRWETAAPGRWPFETLPEAHIRRDGFVQVPPGALEPLPVYYGFDGGLLFGEWFLSQHCFRTVAGGAGGPGLVGVSFTGVTPEPADDIEGTLWLDRATLALRRVDFSFVGTEVFDPQGRGGGTLHFVQLPDGTWLPGAWRLRAVAPATRDVRSLRGDFRERRAEVGEYREIGGTLRTVVRGAADTVLALPPDAFVALPAVPTP